MRSSQTFLVKPCWHFCLIFDIYLLSLQKEFLLIFSWSTVSWRRGRGYQGWNPGLHMCPACSLPARFIAGWCKYLWIIKLTQRSNDCTTVFSLSTVLEIVNCSVWALNGKRNSTWMALHSGVLGTDRIRTLVCHLKTKICLEKCIIDLPCHCVNIRVHPHKFILKACYTCRLCGTHHHACSHYWWNIKYDFIASVSEMHIIYNNFQQSDYLSLTLALLKILYFIGAWLHPVNKYLLEKIE